MNILKNFRKLFTDRNLVLLGVIVVIIALGHYSFNKGNINDFMTNQKQADQVIQAVQSANNVQAAHPAYQNEQFAAVKGGSRNVMGLPPSCTKQAIQDPASLLPKDENSEWAKLNPSGNGNLSEVNLLKSGYHVGIDTVAGTLRNANLQLRSEPANPQINVGPWNNTTIEPDLMRVPLEIGCGPQ